MTPDPDAVSAGDRIVVDGRPLTGPDPRNEQPRRLPKASEEQTLYLILSPLYGYGLAEFARRLPPDSVCLTVELHPALAASTDSYRTWRTTDRIASAFTMDEALALGAATIQRRAIRRLRTISLSGGARLFPSEYQSLRNALTARIERFWRNRATEIRLGRRWITNLFRNALRDTHLIGDAPLQTKPTAVLIGAGPYAHRVLDHIESELRRDDGNRPTVCCIDTALPLLAERAITPDFVFALDGQLANARDLVPWRWDDVALIADLTAHSSMPRHFTPGNRYTFHTPFARLSIFSEDWMAAALPANTHVVPYGSVAPAAVDILVRYGGVRSLLLVGVDFWYRPPASHAAGSAPGRMVEHTRTRVRAADGYAELMARPWHIGSLADGQDAMVDGVLADHAAQLRALVLRMRERESLEIVTAHVPGLDTGARRMPIAELGSWLASRVASHPPVEPHRSPSVHSRVVTAPQPVVSRSDLFTLHVRIERQIAYLEQRETRCFIDAGLDFVLLDLPQWPRMTVTLAAMELHRERILRSLRDYRRRLARIIREADYESSGAPLRTDRKAD